MSVVVHEPEWLAYPLGPPPPIISYSRKAHDVESLARNLFLEGNHRVHGTVRAESEPDGSATVLLFNSAMSSSPLRAVKTDPNGRYAFEYIRPGRYHVVALDDSDPPYHPDIVRVDSEPMP